MELSVVAQKKWAYTLYRLPGSYVLAVLCGSAAMYELNIPLLADEVAQALESEKSLEGLVERIRNSPNSYSTRSIFLD